VDVRVLIDELTGAGPVEADDALLRELYAPPRLPWLRVNMVSTADGSATGANGRTGSINNAADKRVFDLLRADADAVLVGAGTARAERYRPASVPLVVVSARGTVPELLRDAPPGQVLLATCAEAPGLAGSRELLGTDQVLVSGDAAVDLLALRGMLVERGLVHLLSEGGPTLLGDLVRAGVLDELCLTTVPHLVGGEHPRIVLGADVDTGLDLRVLLEQDGTLLGRYFLR
jgi:riboflavin biosynthesis pyrimidine reductase